MGSKEEPDFPGLLNLINLKLGLNIEGKALEGLDNLELKDKIYEIALASYEEKERSVGPDLMRHLERMVFLQIIDSKWKDHLYAMDSLREGIGLRAYGQRDPLIEYKRDVILLYGLHVFFIFPKGEKAAVHLRMKRLNPAIQHLRKTRMLRYVFNGNTERPYGLCCAAGRQYLDSELI